MNPSEDQLDDHFHDVLKAVIQPSHLASQTDDLARALLGLLVRVGNSWRSIRTLRTYTSDGEGFIVDAGTLLRAMFDAYLQAAYVAHDPAESMQRARDYLDFHIVERRKRARAIMQHSNLIADALKNSPNRAQGEATLEQEYDRVKARFFVERRLPDGSIERGPRCRSQWYVGDLAQLARQLGKQDEYDVLLATFHGCVHSSWNAVSQGPPISPEYVVAKASSIAARVAKLSVDHNRIQLNELHAGILNALCTPYFSTLASS